MKKIYVSIIALIVAIMASVAVASAKDVINEKPDVSIVIEGKLGKYADVPLNIDGRTMLPLREVLTNLGVPNDDEHISWNASKKTITIISGNDNIFLSVGNNKAMVNGEELTLDVAPVIYSKNSRTYIPTRFVAESLGKAVVWDNASKSVLIKDKEKFNKVLDILTKSEKAMEKVERCKYTMKLNMDAQGMSEDEVNSFKMDMNYAGEFDKVNKSLHMRIEMKSDLFGMLAGDSGVDLSSITTETYIANGASYTQNPLDGSWTKEDLDEESFNEMFNQQSNMNTIDANEVIAAALDVEENENGIVLKGNMFLQSLLGEAFGNNELFGGSDMTATDFEDLDKVSFNFEIVIDSKEYYTKSIKMKMSYDSEEEGKVSLDFDINYSDFNGDIKIVVPDAALLSGGDIKM